MKLYIGTERCVCHSDNAYCADAQLYVERLENEMVFSIEGDSEFGCPCPFAHEIELEDDSNPRGHFSDDSEEFRLPLAKGEEVLQRLLSKNEEKLQNITTVGLNLRKALDNWGCGENTVTEFQTRKVTDDDEVEVEQRTVIVSLKDCIVYLPGQTVETDSGDEMIVTIPFDESGQNLFDILELLEKLPGANDIGLEFRFGLVSIIGDVARAFKSLE
jgi:hypothetical protein